MCISHRLVRATVIPGTKPSAQALAWVRMATAAIALKARASPIRPVLAKRAKHNVLSSIPRVERCSVITRPLDSCTSGDKQRSSQ